MGFLLFMAALLVAGGALEARQTDTPVAAQWLNYNEDHEATYFFDPTSVKVTGDRRRVWSLLDFKQRQPLGFLPAGVLSVRMLKELDCKEKRWRGLRGSTHSEPMAGGASLFNVGEDSKGWRSFLPGSVPELEFQFVCSMPQPTQWVKHVENIEAVYYFAPTNIMVVGDIRGLWTIIDMNQPDPKGVMSYLSLHAFHCKEKLWRSWLVSGHSEPMAGGKILLNAPNRHWATIEPGAVVEGEFELACAPFPH